MAHIIWAIQYQYEPIRACRKRHKAKQVEEMSKFLGTDLDDETIQKIAKHCTFANLKNVKSFDLSIQMKEFNDCLPFKVMRVSSVLNIGMRIILFDFTINNTSYYNIYHDIFHTYYII